MTMGMVHDPVGDASQKKPLDRAFALAADDDQIAVVLLGRIQDLAADVTAFL